MLYALSAPIALVAGCAGLPGRTEPVSVNVADLRMGTAGVFEQQYFVTLRVRNPNDRDLNVKGVVFELDVNGKPFAKGSAGKAVSIPAFGSQLVEVEAVSTLTGILRQLGDVSRDRGGPPALKYRIAGRLYQSGVGGALPFADEGEIDLRDMAGAGEGK